MTRVARPGSSSTFRNTKKPRGNCWLKSRPFQPITMPIAVQSDKPGCWATFPARHPRAKPEQASSLSVARER